MRSILSSAKFFLVQSLNISNKEAISLIQSKRVLINGLPASLHQPISCEDEVTLDDKQLKSAQALVYIAYYKPRGVECTLNPNILNNLPLALNLPYEVYPVGRLDKESEGLLLLTNDGSIYNKIVNSDSHQEKEYVVGVDKTITNSFIEAMAAGVVIMGQTTRPASVWQIDENKFGIILTQGLNRQIRRMCYKLGYEVHTLVRVRIVQLTLGNLQPGQTRMINKEEIGLTMISRA